MLNLPISDETLAAIQQAAAEAQAHLEHEESRHYRVDDLQTAFWKWLESSLEALATDAMYHAFEGDRSYAFNRRAFETALERIDYAEHPAEADEREAA